MELLYQLLYQRVVDLFERLLDGEGHAGVVDILRGETEVYELFGLSGKTAERTDFLLNEILDSLDVVVGHLLDVLHTLGVLDRELTIDVTQGFKQAVVEILKLGKRELAERNKVFDFYTHTITYQGVFREIVCQSIGLTTIAAINRRDGCQYI